MDAFRFVNFEESLLFSVVSLMPRTGFEDACNEHIALVKSGEDNQWIQLRRMLIKEPVFTPYTIVQHSFREPLIVVYFSRLRCTDTPCFSTWLHFHFSYRMKTLPIVVSIVFNWQKYIICTKVKALSWYQRYNLTRFPFGLTGSTIATMASSFAISEERSNLQWNYPMTSDWKIIVPRDTADSLPKVCFWFRKGISLQQQNSRALTEKNLRRTWCEGIKCYGNRNEHSYSFSG